MSAPIARNIHIFLRKRLKQKINQFCKNKNLKKIFLDITDKLCDSLFTPLKI